MFVRHSGDVTLNSELTRTTPETEFTIDTYIVCTCTCFFSKAYAKFW